MILLNVKKVYKKLYFNIIIFFYTVILYIKFNNLSFRNIITTVESQKVNSSFFEVNPNVVLELVRAYLNKCFNNTNCLLRSAISFVVLKRLGISVNFYIGVNYDKNIESHAWLEIKKKPILEPSIEKYKVIYQF